MQSVQWIIRTSKCTQQPHPTVTLTPPTIQGPLFWGGCSELNGLGQNGGTGGCRVCGLLYDQIGLNRAIDDARGLIQRCHSFRWSPWMELCNGTWGRCQTFKNTFREQWFCLDDSAFQHFNVFGVFGHVHPIKINHMHYTSHITDMHFGGRGPVGPQPRAAHRVPLQLSHRRMHTAQQPRHHVLPEPG